VLRNRCSALNCVRHHSFTPRAVEFVGPSPSGRQTADNDTLPSQNPSLTLKTSRMAELAGCAQEVLDFEEVGLSIKTN
jgi:hypothetical protein